MNKESNRKIVKRYGMPIQSTIAMEECAELIQAISKMKRDASDKNYEHLVEEMADVYIVLDQLQFMFNIKSDDLESMIVYKQSRNEARMKYGDDYPMKAEGTC